MKLILISGNGYGAGKDTFAEKLGAEVHHLADSIRSELQEKYNSNYERGKVDFWDDPKDTIVEGTKTIRDLLIQRGQEACEKDPLHWCKHLVKKLMMRWDSNLIYRTETSSTVAIADIRKLVEVEYFRSLFIDIVHVHIIGPKATYEPQFQNEELEKIADYVITWKEKANATDEGDSRLLPEGEGTSSRSGGSSYFSGGSL